MASPRDTVILFTRYPHPGKCKGRLIPALGKEGAAKIHRQLVSHILKILHHFITLHKDIECHIYYDGASPQEMEEWLGSDHPFTPQQGKDLGARMAHALSHGLGSKRNTVLIGSDCPDINHAILEEALCALKDRDMVLGPAHDGGYYLIGVAGRISPDSCRELFEQIPWGTDTVFAKTLKRAETLGFAPHILAKLHDIDSAEDLKHFHHCPHPE